MTLQKIGATATVASVLLLSAAGIASAQTTTSPTPTTVTPTTVSPTPTTATPGVPNTGAGGDATANMLLLGTSALVVAGGGLYIARMARS